MANTDPMSVTDDMTIWAKAKVGDVESEVVSATYIKLPDTTVDVTDLIDYLMTESK